MRRLMEILLIPQHGQGGIPYSPFSGVAEAAFYCAHRTRHNNVAPSKLVRSLSPGDGGLIDLPLRALQFPHYSFKGSLVDPLLRASNDINAPSKLARFSLGMGAD